MPDSAARSAFPSILKHYMEENDISQVDLSKQLHVTKQTISDWVNGKKFPRVDKMQQLANLFGVLMSDMYTSTIKKMTTGDLPVKFSDSFDSYVATPDELTSDEHELLTLYRGADDRAREDAIDTLRKHQKQDTAVKAI